jgi:hypothetical protein
MQELQNALPLQLNATAKLRPHDSQAQRASAYAKATADDVPGKLVPLSPKPFQERLQVVGDSLIVIRKAAVQIGDESGVAAANLCFFAACGYTHLFPPAGLGDRSECVYSIIGKLALVQVRRGPFGSSPERRPQLRFASVPAYLKR